MNPFGLVMAPIILACSHGVFGGDCDQDIRCWNALKMPRCYWRHNAPIQSPAYREALRRGANVRAKITVGDRNPVVEFLF